MKSIRIFTLLELFMVCFIILLLVSLTSRFYGVSVRKGYQVHCMNNLRSLYQVGVLFTDDGGGKQGHASVTHDYYFSNWASLISQYHPNIASALMCPDDGEEKTSAPASSFHFKYTANGGGDIPIAPGPLAKIYETFSNPPGWRIGLEDWIDSDHNDLVVDVRQYPTYLEVKTVSASLSGDIHFADSKGNIVIPSLPKKLNQSIRVEGGALTSYGIHQTFDESYMTQSAADQPANTVYMMGYFNSTIKPDTDEWHKFFDSETGYYSFARHFGKANTTFCDGSVKEKNTDDLNPALEGNMAKYWQTNQSHYFVSE